MPIAMVRAGLQYAWRGPSLVIVSDAGSLDARSHTLHGYYYREARFLSRLDLTINGHRPWLCECAAIRPDLLSFTLIHPEITAPGGGGTGQSDDQEHVGADGLPERSLDLWLTLEPCLASLRVSLVIANRSRRQVSFTVRCDLDADFADLLEAQAGHREQQAQVDVSSGPSRLVLAYTHRDLPYSTHVDVAEGWHVVGPSVSAPLVLEPRETRSLVLDVVPEMPGERLQPADVRARASALQSWSQDLVSISVPGNRLVECVLASNIDDIASLAAGDGPEDEWLTLQAGMPLYPAFFGRDAVTAGWQAGMIDGGAALDAALTKLGRVQATDDDQWTDAEPGRIPYQMRSGPLARLRLNPYSAYYADYASPLMYVISLANLFAWRGDVECVRRHWDTARRIMDWAREHGDLDGDGYLEYQTRSPKGTKNQGWKDSGDAIVYDDGRPVPAPIATCELQGYWYVAQKLMAVLCAVMHEIGDAAAYRQAGQQLKARFNQDWWSEEEQFFALALDPDKRLVRAPSSNVGHCLATGIIDTTHLAAVVGRLFAPDLFSGWGIRTLSSNHAYYDPLSYHRGSVWAVEQATIVYGLRRFGFEARAVDLSAALFELAQAYPGYRIPECVGGYARSERPTPGAYPRANTPQLWNATAFPLLVQSLLGIVPLAPIETLVLDPVLPDWMPHVVVRGLRVGAARVTFECRRRLDGHTDWNVLHRQGRVHVVRQPPPESRSATAADRVWGLMETLVH